MLRSYEAIYDHGRVEWVGAAPRAGRTRILVVVDEPAGTPEPAETPNGDRLAELLEGMGISSREALCAKFGNPVEWQRQERHERGRPGQCEG